MTARSRERGVFKVLGSGFRVRGMEKEKVKTTRERGVFRYLGPGSGLRVPGSGFLILGLVPDSRILATGTRERTVTDSKGKASLGHGAWEFR
jgi:hypothetical protein